MKYTDVWNTEKCLPNKDKLEKVQQTRRMIISKKQWLFNNKNTMKHLKV